VFHCAKVQVAWSACKPATNEYRVMYCLSCLCGCEPPRLASALVMGGATVCTVQIYICLLHRALDVLANLAVGTDVAGWAGGQHSMGEGRCE
jgi:hypothetical protein